MYMTTLNLMKDVAVSAKKKESHLTLISNPLTYEQRMEARIEALRRDLFSGDGDMEYCEEMLRCIHDYLLQYEDEDIIMSIFKIKEAIFYVAHFNDY